MIHAPVLLSNIIIMIVFLTFMQCAHGGYKTHLGWWMHLSSKGSKRLDCSVRLDNHIWISNFWKCIHHGYYWHCVLLFFIIIIIMIMILQKDTLSLCVLHSVTCCLMSHDTWYIHDACCTWYTFYVRAVDFQPPTM